jgi:L-ascorbate metabolism protein UlaG (beta-lactamase superfamily)
MIKYTWWGHACFTVEAGGKKLLFDPFISPNPKASNIDVGAMEADYILVSHGHGDHIADAVTIAKNTGATIIGSYEVAEWLGAKGATKNHPMNTGGKKQFDFGTVRCVVAQHSSAMPDGSYGGNPMGFLVTTPDGNFYYSGDTALTLDMQLIPNWAKTNFAILPIGDNFTMGAEDAAQAAKMVQTKKVIGVHYDTFGFITINHQEAKAAFAAQDVQLLLPALGETIEL